MELVIAAIAAILALITVGILSKSVLSKDPGPENMRELSRMIQEGAQAFLKREYTWVFSFVIVIAFIFTLVPAFAEDVPLGWQTALAFMFGSIMSATAGYIGMSIATRANGRTAYAAQTGGLKDALGVAVSGGGVMGLSVVGLALLGLVIVYYVAGGVPEIVNGYAMGASLMALFARSGGGIYTKGADMGADLVGKVESGLPEDDPRNPAVIADNVGDNVGDVAGLGSDLLESYVASLIAALAIASYLNVAELSILPFAIASVGIVASIIGIFTVRTLGSKNPQQALMMGTYVAGIITIIGTFFIVQAVGTSWTGGFGEEYSKMAPFWATLIGVLAGMAIGFTSEYFTSADYKPVKRLAEESQTGPAITVTSGISVGMKSTAVPVIVLALAVVTSNWLGGYYCITMAAIGMLATTGMVVAVDSYGPIADNAGGIAEMASLPPEVREITDNLDSVGNTTAAIGKGFAIGSAAFAAISLISAFLSASGIGGEAVGLTNVNVVAGLLIGGMLPFYFSSRLFEAVSSAAYKMIDEVRRQFKEIPGLLEGTAKPDSARCVDISTQGAIYGMLVPGLMAILVPPVIGFLLGPAALAGVLVGALVCGVMLGIQTANSGGAMDNAKKYIEEGHFGGKNSEAHKAAVVGDTVGDPLKDTVGPSINILIKLMAVISLVLAPLFV